jgi:hypothetical protein
MNASGDGDKLSKLLSAVIVFIDEITLSVLFNPVFMGDNVDVFIVDTGDVLVVDTGDVLVVDTGDVLVVDTGDVLVVDTGDVVIVGTGDVTIVEQLVIDVDPTVGQAGITKFVPSPLNETPTTPQSSLHLKTSSAEHFPA